MIPMTWATFYLACFIVGVVFSLLSILGSVRGFHISARLHLPHFFGHHPSPMHVGHAHIPGAVRPGGMAAGARGGMAARGAPVSFFNFSSLMAFLAWFGGTGYLLTRYSDFWTVLTFGISLAGGLVAAAIVFFFLVKVLLAHETVLDPADYAPAGVLGKVNVGIRPGGTGEIVFSQGGTRRAAGARSEDGKAIPKGTEVIITHYEKGIAYVRTFADMAGEQEPPAGVAEADRK